MRLMTVSVAEQVAHHLANQIIEGKLQAKEHIQEARLVDEFKVSRSSVREALLILARWHMIDIYPNRGAMVCTLSLQSTQQFFALWRPLLAQLLLDLSMVAPQETEALLKQIAAPAGKLESTAVFCQRIMAKLKKLFMLSENIYLNSILVEYTAILHHYLYFLLSLNKITELKIQQFVRIILQLFKNKQLDRLHTLCVG